MKNERKFKVGQWATEEDILLTFLIISMGESSTDTDEGTGYFDALFDDSGGDHVDYHCRHATQKEIEMCCSLGKTIYTPMWRTAV